MSRNTGCLLAACAWLAIVATASRAWAQERDDVDEPLRAERQDVILADPNGMDLDKTVEQWVYGGQSADAVRKRIEAALAQNIKRFDQKYGLTSDQKKKLDLAGRYDMKRFFDQVEEVKVEYRRVKGDWNQMGDRIFALQRTLNQLFTELFGDGSMLVKTLKKNLTHEQVSRHDKAIYRQRVEWMAGLLRNRLNLNSDQRSGLVSLVVEETPPLKRYGTFDYDAIMFQLSRVPREKLRKVLDEGQCRELKLRFDQAQRMESILVSEGYLTRAATPSDSATENSGGSTSRDGEKAAFTGTSRRGGDSP
jgi:hypothetical protein